MAWFAMNNWGLFPMNVLSKAGEEDLSDVDGTKAVPRLRGTVSTGKTRGTREESLKDHPYNPLDHVEEYRRIVQKYGVSSKEARHFHLRNRAALAVTNPDGNGHSNYAAVYGDDPKSNARMAHVHGNGEPSDKDKEFHENHANSQLPTDHLLHDAISDYAHKLQAFIQRAYTMAAGRGGSAGGGRGGVDGTGLTGHGANIKEIVGQLVTPKYHASVGKTPASRRSDDEESAVEEALKGIMGADARQYTLDAAGPLLRALQKVKDRAKKVKGPDGKSLDVYRDKLFTAPAYFHEIFSKVGTTNPTDTQLTSHHYDAAQWGKATRKKSPIDDYYGFLERLKPGEKVPVTATEKAGNTKTMLQAQTNKNNSKLVTSSVAVKPATDMMRREEAEGATAGQAEVTRREYDSEDDSFPMQGRRVVVPGAAHSTDGSRPNASGSSHIGVTRGTSNSHGGVDAPVSAETHFDGLRDRFHLRPGEIRKEGTKATTAIARRIMGPDGETVWDPQEADTDVPILPGARSLDGPEQLRAARGQQVIGASRGLGPEGEQYTRATTQHDGSQRNRSLLQRSRTGPDKPEYVRRPKPDAE